MTKSAETLRVEKAIIRFNNAVANEHGPHSEFTSYGPILAESQAAYVELRCAIDLAIAARAAEVGEGMHAAGCECRPAQPYTEGFCTPYCEGQSDPIHQDQEDPRCTEARKRFRDEVERLTSGQSRE
jgi:hypothetical protein